MGFPKEALRNIETYEMFGDDGLLGYSLKLNVILTKDQIDEIKKILSFTDDEIKVVEIVRKMKASLNDSRTSDYQKLGIDLHELLTEYFLKKEDK